jgi:hypothetical protein
MRRATLLTAALLLPLGQVARTADGMREHGQARVGATGIGDPYYPTLGNAGYDAQHYTLDLQVDVRRDTIAGTVTMTARALHDLTGFSLDLVGFHIGKVLVDGAPAAYTHPARKLLVRPARPLRAGHIFTAVFAYSGVPTTIPTSSGDQSTGTRVLWRPSRIHRRAGIPGVSPILCPRHAAA